MAHLKYFHLPQNGPEWQRLHNKNEKHEGTYLFTASGIPSCIGLGSTSRSLMFDYYYGTKPEPDVSNIPQVKWGNDHEMEAINHFLKTHKDFCGLSKVGMVMDKTRPYIGGSPDAYLLNLKEGREYLLEIKCSAKDENVPLGPEGVPIYHIIQTTVQMACYGVDRCILNYWRPSMSRAYHIEFDPSFYQQICFEVDAFKEAIEAGKKPGRKALSASMNIAINNAKRKCTAFQ